jgi:hypothetical protein
MKRWPVVQWLGLAAAGSWLAYIIAQLRGFALVLHKGWAK